MPEQGSLLPSQGDEILALPQAQLRFVEGFLSPEASGHYQGLLRSTIQWECSTIYLYGRSVKIPRLNAWYGDKGCNYQYSGTHFSPLDWTDPLLEIKCRVEAIANTTFNSVLLNCYRHGQDSMGWHSDDEQELGQNPVIASVSLGQTRAFHLRHKTNKALGVQKLALTTGSLLIMSGTTQHYWQHQIPKTKKICQERISLTFRRVLNEC